MAINQLNRKRIVIFLAVIVSLATAYYCGWMYVAFKIESGFSNLKEKYNTTDLQINHKDIEISGFPWGWCLKIERPRLKIKNRFLWTTSLLKINLKSWDYKSFKFQTFGSHQAHIYKNNSLKHIKAKMNTGVGQLRLDQFGKIQEIKFSVKENIIQIPSSNQIRFKKLSGSVHLNKKHATKNDINQSPSVKLEIDLSSLVIPKTFLPKMENKIAEIKLSTDLHGRLEGSNLKNILTNWTKHGGVIEINKMMLNWGELNFFGNGTFALDENLQPIAALSAKITGQNATINSMVVAGLIKARTGMLLNFLTNAMTNKKRAKNQAIKISLAVQDGFLYLGPIKFFKIPEIRWN
tara:strand:+ start:9818 stop:10867 length:1050 start_codon:yes stop_codon:yes gene_type:complete